MSSPDGKLTAEISTGDRITYSVLHLSDRLLAESEISLTLTDGTVYGGAAKVRKASRRSVDQVHDAAVYKKSKVRDNFNELTLKFKHFSLVFRAYDAGIAYRFISHSKVPFEVQSELAEFAFPEDWNMYVPYVRQNTQTLETQYWNSFENTYEYTPLSKWNKERLGFLPLMVDCPKGKKVVITESDLLDYPGMYLYNGDGSTVLRGHHAPYPAVIKQGGYHELQGVVLSREPYIARCAAEAAFPWRIVSVSDDDAMMADNDLVWLLASPSDPETDFSWVRPGKVAWDWWNDWNIYGVDFEAGINNATYKYYIDFASSNGIEYVILDEGWAVNLKADLFQIVPEINLEELCAYAAERNVGLILWAGYMAMDRDMEKVCSHYSKMGIKGFKVDFMDRDDQIAVDFHRRAAAMGAKYGLLMDFHGTYKPTGLQRTYPNVVNFEGVHGLEQLKWTSESVDQVTYDVIIPFIRMVAGPMDYTQGAMRNANKGNWRPVGSEPMSQGTRCRQLAEYVIFEAPVNMLCDSPSNYMNEPECTKFIASVPEVWDETEALAGKVGNYIAMARRSGDVWYVGALTNWDAREMKLPVDYLADGAYTIEAYRDGANAHRAARDYRKECHTFKVSGGKITEGTVPAEDGCLKMRLYSGGGYAAVITPCK